MCGRGEGGERENGWSKEDEDKALPTWQKLKRARLRAGPPALPLWVPLLCCSFWKKKKERERGREQSVRAALISTWTTAGRLILKDKTKKALSMWQSVEWQQQGGGWGMVGQLRGWLLRHFSWWRGKQELSGLKTMIWAQRLVRCWTDSGVWQTVLLHKVLPEWGVEFKRGPEGPRVPATKWEKRWKSHRRGKRSPGWVKDM